MRKGSNGENESTTKTYCAMFEIMIMKRSIFSKVPMYGHKFSNRQTLKSSVLASWNRG